MGKISGTVAKWLNHKGIGFITPDGAEEDVLVHYAQIKQESDDGFKSLEAGTHPACSPLRTKIRLCANSQ